jgi:hypothetical protein
MLADLLRTDGRRLQVLVPTERATLDLQALSRQRSNLVATRTSLTNQLRALPEAHWPGAARLFNNLQSWLLLRSLRTNIELLIRVRWHPAQVPKGRARVGGSADSVRTPRSDSRSRSRAPSPRNLQPQDLVVIS